jgi:hypothetical protein
LKKNITSKVGTLIEYLMVVAILFSLYKALAFFHSAGYLPPPFFDQPLDTFMDWYNTVYWGYRPGTYNEWYSVYPPFAFLFMKFFSNPACYDVDAGIARNCDPIGAWTITVFTIVNVVLILLNYLKIDKKTAFPRTLALGLGMPALFAWERGNVIVPCFTFFILAHGRALRSTWLRWICFGITVNLKPYLVLAVLGRLARRKWRWAEGCAIACVLIYAASYIILGKGDPLSIITNTIAFSGVPNSLSIDHIEYTTSYVNMLDMTRSQLPLTYFIGSKPIEFVESSVFWAIRVGAIGVFACFAIAAWRPALLSAHRLAALSIVFFFAASGSAGGYAEVFLLFLVFYEKWGNIGQVFVLLAAYSLCIPWDIVIVPIIDAVTDSYLSGRSVSFTFGVTLGAVIRPGLILLIEYGLVVASFVEFFRAGLQTRDKSAEVATTGHA